MITSQLIGQVTESLIPYIMYKSRVTKVSKEGKKIVMKTADLSNDIERQGTQERYLVSESSLLGLTTVNHRHTSVCYVVTETRKFLVVISKETIISMAWS